MSDIKKDEIKDVISDIGHSIDGIPLPPEIKKSLWKALGQLITGLVDVPVAYLEAKAQEIRAKSSALTLITKRASEAAAEKFEHDDKLIERTVNYFGQKLLREQINREAIVAKAIEELKQDPPKEDSTSNIDADWLEMFARISEQKSNEDIQLFLSKILAGEIRKPGTFSPQSINLLALLSQDIAQLFQKFCDLSFSLKNSKDLTFVIVEPFGSPGSNSMTPFGFSYPNLTKLQDAGLIQHDLTAYRELHPVIFLSGINVGGKSFPAAMPGTKLEPQMKRIKAINFTNAGLEIRSVLHLGRNEQYEEKLLEWMSTSLKITLKN